jgi:hypothetical protein
MEGVHLFAARLPQGWAVGAQPTWVRWGLYYALVMAILVFGEFSSRQFIYFQF